MWCIKLLIAVSEIDYHGIQNVEPFSDLGVLPDVISEDIGTTVEDFQCVKSWEVSCQITVIVYKDSVKSPTDGGDGRDKFINIQYKGLFQERYGSRENKCTSFLFIEKRTTSNIDCKDTAFAARKYRKVDFV